MGMCISISNMVPVSLRIIFHWRPIQSTPDCGTVQIFVHLEHLIEGAQKFDHRSMQEGHPG